MTALNKLYKNIIPFCPDLPDPVADTAIFWAVQEFLKGSGILKYEFAPIDAVAGQAEYQLTPPPDDRLVYQGLRVRFCKKPLTYRSKDALDLDWKEDGTQERLLTIIGSLYYGTNRSDGWQDLTTTLPYYYYQSVPDTLRLVAIPDTSIADALIAEMSLILAEGATDIDDHLYARYFMTWAQGAQAYCKKMPGKPWSNPNQAIIDEGMFQAKIAEAKGDAQRDFGRKDRPGRVRCWS